MLEVEAFDDETSWGGEAEAGNRSNVLTMLDRDDGDLPEVAAACRFPNPTRDGRLLKTKSPGDPPMRFSLRRAANRISDDPLTQPVRATPVVHASRPRSLDLHVLSKLLALPFDLLARTLVPHSPRIDATFHSGKTGRGEVLRLDRGTRSA